MTSVSAQTLEQLQQENARLLALIGQQKQTIEHQKSSIETLQHQPLRAMEGRRPRRVVRDSPRFYWFPEGKLTKSISGRRVIVEGKRFARSEQTLTDAGRSRPLASRVGESILAMDG